MASNPKTPKTPTIATTVKDAGTSSNDQMHNDGIIPGAFPLATTPPVFGGTVLTKAERTDYLMANMKAKCGANRDEIVAALERRNEATTSLKEEKLSTVAAISAIMALCSEVVTWPTEEQKRFIEGLKIVNKAGKERPLIFGKKAQGYYGIAVPLTQYGFNGMSGGHVSKAGAVAQLCLTKGISPAGLGEFLATNGGFVKTYELSKVNDDCSAVLLEKKTVKERADKVQFLKQKTAIGNAFAIDTIGGSGDGLHCVICVRKADGLLYPVAPVRDIDGTLYATLLAGIDDAKCGKADALVTDEQLRDGVAAAAKLAAAS